jgi:hypothetical protein
MEVRRIHRKKPVELQGHQLAVAKQSNYPLVYRRKTPKSPKIHPHYLSTIRYLDGKSSVFGQKS